MSEATTPRLKVSREGVVLIKSFEGFRPHAVRGEDGRWVIGYGHTASAREGLGVGEQDAELLLQYDLLPVVRTLNERAPAGLNQHQFDALASFAISVGVERFLASDVLQRLNEGRAGLAADALIGWPETPSPDSRLRRRAAERALFVADPGSAVTLADLLAAPLPPPIEPVEPAEPEADPFDARAAAVAALLGETPGPGPDPEATPVAPADPAAPGQNAPAAPAAATPPAAFNAAHLSRYSPYAAAIVGPLPGFEPVSPQADTSDTAPVEADAPDAPTIDVARLDAPEAASPVQPVAEPLDLTPVTPLVSAPPAISPFPDMDQPLVLTPLTEADMVSIERPVWPEEAREVPSDVEENVLFEDEPIQSVLRHEVEPAPLRRFDWSETGAYLAMGGVGLIACAASAASFRKAMIDDSFIGDFTVIGWVLAIIGVICVGLSSWKLYVRWGRPD
ncbi:lysozyme [Brevundimonas sp.]|uniref:lysozyme n=1 Tax=Brevundimonas sp. TaxID=1871086 RepID=UPI002C3E4C32|nr:lysozyme [Brevundimonas sp.]HWQ85745.1 lysozyme [Brevundimonas sp.]